MCIIKYSSIFRFEFGNFHLLFILKISKSKVEANSNVCRKKCEILYKSLSIKVTVEVGCKFEILCSNFKARTAILKSLVCIYNLIINKKVKKENLLTKNQVRKKIKAKEQ